MYPELDGARRAGFSLLQRSIALMNPFNATYGSLPLNGFIVKRNVWRCGY